MIAVLVIIFLVHQARGLLRHGFAMFTQTIKAVTSICLAIFIVAVFVALMIAANV